MSAAPLRVRNWLRLGCAHCRNAGPDPGWIEQCNNGPIVPCPVCNPITESDIAWDRAEAQRDGQRRARAAGVTVREVGR